MGYLKCMSYLAKITGNGEKIILINGLLECWLFVMFR